VSHKTQAGREAQSRSATADKVRAISAGPAGDRSRAQAAKRGSGTWAAQGRPGGERQRQPVQKVAAWRKRGAASPPRSQRRVSPWAPGCL